MEFDVARHIGAMTHEVVPDERDGRPTRIVIAGRSFATGIEDAWDAITNAERIPRWFAPVEGQLEPGGHYQITGNAGGTILECEPPRRFALSWEFGGNTSWVYVALSEDGDATRLELRHEAVVDPQSEGFWTRFGPGAVGVGWDLSFLGLAEHLEQGWSKPPETDTEWTRTDNYRTVVQRSSDSWRDASIAYGTDAQAAGEAADRTAGAYSGAGG